MSLDERLLLRSATAEDAAPLGEFVASVFGNPARILPWMADLVCGRHPYSGADDVLVVEDTATGALVSTASLVRQTWTYGDVPFQVGQVETVATHPDWRRRGLVRHLMTAHAARCDAYGIDVRAVIGIPHYYRQFGYEHALTHQVGRVVDPVGQAALRGQPTQHRLRPARAEDIATLERLGRRASARLLVSCPRDERLWRYELTGHLDGCHNQHDVRVLESASGEVVAVAVTTDVKFWPNVGVVLFEVADGVSFVDAVPAFVAQLERPADARLLMLLGAEHPAYQAAPVLLRETWASHGWYLAVPDIAGFLRQVSPALSASLAASAAADVTADLTISHYDGGLTIHIEQGTVAGVSARAPGEVGEPGLALRRDQLLHLVFGLRTFGALTESSLDCYAVDDRTRAICDGLFPGRASHLWQLL